MNYSKDIPGRFQRLGSTKFTTEGEMLIYYWFGRGVPERLAFKLLSHNMK